MTLDALAIDLANEVLHCANHQELAAIRAALAQAHADGVKEGMERAAKEIEKYSVEIDGVPMTTRNLKPLADAIRAEMDKGEPQ